MPGDLNDFNAGFEQLGLPDSSMGMQLYAGDDGYGGGGGGGYGGMSTIQPVGLRVGTLLKMIGQQLGVKVTLGSIVSLVGKFGLAAASAALGIDAGSIITLTAAAQAKRGRRRGRGVTGRQLQNAKRVIHVIDRMHSEIHRGSHRGGRSSSRQPPQFRRRRRAK